MLKGGKNPLEANHFIEFVLGEKGQKLWMFPAGAPGGPTQSTLLRMPVRENIYRDYPEFPVRLKHFFVAKENVESLAASLLAD